MIKKIVLAISISILGAAGVNPTVPFYLEDLSGSVSIPQSDGDHPMVFILGDPHYELLKTLSELEVLGIWLDMEVEGKSVQELTANFERYRIGINRWINDEAPELGESLLGKGTFSEVVFIGMGETADGIFEIVGQHHRRQMDVSKVFLLSPKRFTEASAKILPDVPISMALPTRLLDENLVALTYFQSLRQDKGRKHPAAIIFGEQPEIFDPFTEQMAAAEVLGKEAIAPVHEPAPRTLFQMPVKSATVLGGDTRILDPGKFGNPHQNGLNGQNHYYRLTVNHFKGLTDMYQVKGQEGGIFMMAFSGPQDMSQRGALSLYYNYANEKMSPLNMILEFRDLTGQVEQVPIEGLSPFNYGAGSLIPFYQERIILEGLSMVDTSTIISISLLFPEGIEGEFNLGDISLTGLKNQ